MKFTCFTLALLALLSVSCSVEDTDPTEDNIMYLSLNDSHTQYYFVGSDINDSRTFLTDVIESQAAFKYVSQCISKVPGEELNLAVHFTLDSKEQGLKLTEGTFEEGRISQSTSFSFTQVDPNGTVWTTKPMTATNGITIEQIQPYPSKIDGSMKRLLTMSFETTLINASGEAKTIAGHMKSIVE